uniref:G10 protein n=1 Tax=Palpitomonas bilix TaxID=652834 RepID=A0A7S3GA03_9EUKA|mmetsp:Transcript_38785/g.99550  ORF Transcript_38785/g.99550 Transcript_38785/m.99550 type:complete len:183 (+) Transcript_38785:287-835(+)
MPKLTLGRKKPPQGFDLVEPKLEEFEIQMREAVNADHEGKRKVESVWPIHQINWRRSRYIFDLYRDKKISRKVYEYCIDQNWADKQLIAYWKKPGYEKLCCVQALSRNTNFQTVDICRVPHDKLPKGSAVQSQLCGCTGCASCDPGDIFTPWTQRMAEYRVKMEGWEKKEGGEKEKKEEKEE